MKQKVMMTNGWQEVSLGKVLKRADRFEKKDELQAYRFAGTYSFARGIFAGETKEGSTFRLDKIQRIKKGDFIYCKIMAWEGAFGIAPEKVDGCVMSGAFVAYEVDQTQIDPKFLDYYFKQEPVWKTIGSQSTGTNVRRRSLHPNQFEKATIPLPPLTEQRRIVARIESLAARVNEAQSLREEATQETKSVIASKSFDAFAEIKKKYSPKTFGSFSPHVTSGPRYWRDRYSKDGSRFYRAQDIGPHGNILHDTKAYVTPPESDQGKTAMLSAGDLMIVITGATVGRVSVFTDDLEPGYVSQHVSICRLPQDQIVPRYALWWLLSPDGQGQLLGQRYGQGKPGLNLTNIRSIEIPVPPLDEQRRIVAYLDGLQAKVNALRGLQSQSQEELGALLPSVLDRAFKGEL